MNTFQRIRQLTPWQQAAFASALCERMLPNYMLYQEVSGEGDYQTLRNLLNLAWEWLSVPKTRINQETQQEKLEEVTPNTNESSPLGYLLALDCCVALSSLLQSLAAKADPEGLTISKLSQSSVSRFLESTDCLDIAPEALEDAINQHPLMAFEQEVQNELLDLLERNEEGDKSLCAQLKKLALEEGISNIGLEL